VNRTWAIAAALAFGCVAAVAASSAVRPPITQAASGKVVRLAKGEHATLRLSNRWRWSEPRVSTRAVELTPVEYFVDPGFREWTIEAHKSGGATIRSVGRPVCANCTLATRSFHVSVVVSAG
jgi:predicted secreted protein